MKDMDFIIKPRQLTITWGITWGDDHRYLEWIDGVTPRLLSVYLFKIGGRFAMSRLTHGAKYQLTFEVELESWAKGWESPVTLKMVFPDGRSTTRVETLDHHPREQLLMLCVGEFEASGNGEIEFEMAETNDQKEKKGLVIRRVVIQPSSTTTPQERSALPRNPAPQNNPSASSLQDLNMEQRQLSTTGGDYLIIEPRQLSITGADDERRWHWIDGMTPRLLGALGIEIRGRFDMSRLTHGATYQLAFGVELESSAKGWESPVTLKLDLPDGLSKTRIVSLNDQPRDQLLILQVGDFMAGGRGEIKFSMVEAEEHSWKEGLVVKRVVIKSSLVAGSTVLEAQSIKTSSINYYGSRDVGGGGRRFCYDCGETGHTSNECPMKGLPKIEDLVLESRQLSTTGGDPSFHDVIIQPRQLSIEWGDNKRYWHWIDGVTPRLLKVSWLEIRGGFEMSRLMRGAKYQLVFAVELESLAEGWESPVTLKLVLPDGRSTTRVETLEGQPRDQLLMLRVGEFVVAGSGEIKFEMTETVKLNKKKGLVIRRVVIQHSQVDNYIQYSSHSSQASASSSSSSVSLGTNSEGKEGSSSCVICMNARADGCCIPCGHVAVCMSCLIEIKKKKLKCPICRADIERIIKLYL